MSRLDRLGRWLTVRIAAWAMRRGVDTATLDEAMRKSHPHRDWDWRQQVYAHARARNERKTAHGQLVITTTYACGHEQAESALNFNDYGWCQTCEARQPVISTSAHA